MVMDIVVADIPPKYGMLLSRSWGAKLKGTLQLDMSYATIPVFGQQRRLYRETLMKYMVNSQENPHNYPLYSTHSDLDILSFCTMMVTWKNKSLSWKMIHLIRKKIKQSLR
jgi:hypothetical protein